MENYFSHKSLYTRFLSISQEISNANKKMDVIKSLKKPETILLNGIKKFLDLFY